MDSDSSSQPVSTQLNLTTDSEFYKDWKHEYRQDTENAILNSDYGTDSILAWITKTVSNLCDHFQLSHSIEFSTIDTFEQLLIKVIKNGEESELAKKFLNNIVPNLMTVLSLVSKHFDSRTGMDRSLMTSLLKKHNPYFDLSNHAMLTMEFDVLKALNHKITSSLLLGAVERFTKDYILTLGLARKHHIGRVGAKLIRTVYACKLEIYASLKPLMKSDEMFVRFKANKLILAAAIVAAIPFCCGLQIEPAQQDRIVKPLSNDCFVEPSNIIFLRDAILKVVAPGR
ncbi:uncharacterized protein LOC129740989 [Uranotaenia lowii]|uniref:uncharacterized protein LOC129740989 n=1 Tax=Uranotaenia lowii TaxID=190385 RepID=UPI00247A767B|nr:uncharacterized protein LOC129740989 [Uranotaenia lowii]